MRKWIFISVMTMAVPLLSAAQDDMYFVPKKADRLKSTVEDVPQRDTYHSGSDRDVDEYNRHGSYTAGTDSAGNDIISFDGVSGVYPDSAAAYASGDYEYTGRMSRFDDYVVPDAYWAGYYAGRSSRWGWYDPWFDDPWYWGGWYSPWRYGYYGGWYDPWYWGYAGWYGYGWGWHGHGWWGYPHYVVSYNPRPAGTFRHITGTGRRPLAGLGGTAGTGTGRGFSHSGSRRSSGSVRNKSFSASERFGTNRSRSTSREKTKEYINRDNNRFNNGTSTVPSRSSGSFGSGSGFGGSRSGGGFSGGSRSSGGGGSRFGGRR